MDDNVNFVTLDSVGIIEIDEKGDRKIITFPKYLTYEELFQVLKEIGVDDYE